VNNVTRCADCESENREGGHFCEACGASIELVSAEGVLQIARIDTGGEAPVAPMSGGEDAPDPMASGDGDAGAEAPSQEPEPAAEITEPAAEANEPEAEPSTDSLGWPEPSTDSKDPEGDAPADSLGWPEPSTDPMGGDGPGDGDAAAAEEEVPQQPKVGYLVFPDSSEQPIPQSQWLLGRADLAKFLLDPDKSNEISRGHATIFQEGESFFIEDGKTMVQEKPSSNKTWLVRGGSRILVTGTGRKELEDADEIDIAELVRLQFVVK